MVAAGISRPPLTTEHPRISAIFLRMPKRRNGSFTNRPPISNGGRNEAKRPKAGCSAALYLMIPSQVRPNRVTVPIAAKLRYRLMEGSGMCRSSHWTADMFINVAMPPASFRHVFQWSPTRLNCPNSLSVSSSANLRACHEILAVP